MIVPASIPSDCSVYVQDKLSVFFKGVPDGSTVEFPAGGCYKTNLRVEIVRKSDLTIRGNGSWIKSDTENTARTTYNADGSIKRYAVQPTVMILHGDNVRVDGLNVEGDFHLTGPGRSSASTRPAPKARPARRRRPTLATACSAGTTSGSAT